MVLCNVNPSLTCRYRFPSQSKPYLSLSFSERPSGASGFALRMALASSAPGAGVARAGAYSSVSKAWPSEKVSPESRAEGGMLAVMPPVIGVSGVCSSSDSVNAMSDLIVSSGARPLIFERHASRRPARDIEKISALVVMGNDFDVDPALYGQDPHPQTIVERDDLAAQQRATYETEMLRLALDRSMPVLGICGGMHRINVMHGGDLIQHLPDLLGHSDHVQQLPLSRPVAKIRVIGGGLLEEALDFPKEPIFENSYHHQAVGRLGKGFRAAAYIDERKEQGGEPVRVIEALEPDPEGPYAGAFILAIQWHPEFRASFAGDKITGALVNAARGFMLARAGGLQADALRSRASAGVDVVRAVPSAPSANDAAPRASKVAPPPPKTSASLRLEALPSSRRFGVSAVRSVSAADGASFGSFGARLAGERRAVASHYCRA